MPIRGETIGRAYVRILADGSGFDEDVKRQLRESEPMFEQMGGEHGEAYQKGWEDQVDKNHLDKSFEDRLRAGVGRMDAIGEMHGEHFTEGFRDSLRQHFGEDVGDVIGRNLEEAVTKGASFSQIANRLENIRPELTRATQQITDEQNRIWAKANADNEKDYQLHIAKLARMDQMREGSAKIQAQQVKDLDNQYRVLANDVGKFTEGINKNRDSFRELHARIGSLSDEMAILGATSKDSDENLTRLRRSLHGLSNDTSKTEKSTSKLGTALGSAFGKGARNNFVNAVGIMMEKVGTFADKLFHLKDTIKGAFDNLGLIFDQAGGGLSGWIAISGKIVPMLGQIGFAAIGLAGLVGTLTTALLLAAGAAIALASSLAFGLVGALAPLVGLLGPVGVAAGGVALAFLTMDKATRKATLKPFTDGLKKLGSLALPGIMDGLASAMDRLRKPQGEGTIKLFQRVEHMATAAGDAVGKFLDNFAIGIRGPGLGQFIETMTTTLPHTMARLGRILGNTFEGFLGILSTLNKPGGPVDTLLTSLNGISKSFAAWSVSPKAVGFFKEASDSAGALMDVIRPLWDLLSKILEAGRKPGDKMWRDMGEAIQGWSDALSKRDLKTFFSDAKRMGEALGNVIVQIGRLVAALNTPLTRDFAIGLVKVIGDLIDGVANLAGWFGGLNQNVQGLALAFSGVLAVWGPLSRAIVGSRMGVFAGEVANAETRMTALTGAMKTAAGAGGLVLLADGLTHADRGMSVLEDAAGGAALGFAVGGPFGAAIGGAGGMLVGLGNNFLHAGDKAKDAYDQMRKTSPVQAAIANLDDLKDTLDDVTGAYTGETRAAVLSKLQASGAIEEGHKFGLSAREMVNAAMGAGGAFKQLRPVFQSYGDQIDTVKQKQKEMIQQAMSSPFGPATVADARKMLLGGFGDPNEAFISLENQKKGLQERRQELAKLPGVLRDDAREIQRHTRITEDLAGKLKDIPKQIRPKIIDSGILPTARGVANIARRYKLLDGKKIKTLIQASGAETTVKAVQRVIKKLDEAEKKKTKPKIDVDTREAESKVKGVLSKLGIVGKYLSQPSVLLDVTRFDAKNNDVKQKVNETGKLNPQIKVDAQTQQASADLSAVKNQVDNLPSSKTVTITVNTVHHGKASATGGIFYGAQERLIGEAGPEAVVPLNRPLNMVDPAVRQLSAIAQGLTVSATGRGGKSVTTGPITIITPVKDPVVVAQQVVNRIAAASYI